MKTRVTVKAPATTANLGPGFDCMGMALDIWNSIDVELGPGGVEVIGEGADRLPGDRRNLVHRSFRLPFEESGQMVPEVAITSRNQVPLARGLGSSSAAVVGGLLAGNEMAGRPMSSSGWSPSRSRPWSSLCRPGQKPMRWRHFWTTGLISLRWRVPIR